MKLIQYTLTIFIVFSAGSAISENQHIKFYNPEKAKCRTGGKQKAYDEGYLSKYIYPNSPYKVGELSRCFQLGNIAAETERNYLDRIKKLY